ncbi:MAG TPA: ABC transporter permease subunit [Methanothermococcus okinawensis]|uniref:ABC transporter permease subunit n=1 Tax=Methanothermococcus okinawensis TaxID=155863 RepID=A0A832ZBH4_9EURY|nr:ABC transporter permease subunit [Methanothermococcus okinawensis]HIP91068.1 ABC transporter permease subunit [Methanothermococcus okinawensis]
MTWDYIVEGFLEALKLIISGDPDLYDILFRSITVSGLATFYAGLIGIPIGVVLGLSNFKGKEIVKSIFNGLMGIPTVVLGLILYLFLAPAGPLGFLNLIYTTTGISLGQMILVLPIVVSITVNSIESIEKDIRYLALTLGADEIQMMKKIIEEASPGILLSLMTAFNRAIAELGVALMIGGNIFIKGGEMNTRVLTTAIQMYVSRGEISMAIALGIVLLSLVYSISMVVNCVQRRWIEA